MCYGGNVLHAGFTNSVLESQDHTSYTEIDVLFDVFIQTNGFLLPFLCSVMTSRMLRSVVRVLEEVTEWSETSQISPAPAGSDTSLGHFITLGLTPVWVWHLSGSDTCLGLTPLWDISSLWDILDLILTSQLFDNIGLWLDNKATAHYLRHGGRRLW